MTTNYHQPLNYSSVTSISFSKKFVKISLWYFNFANRTLRVLILSFFETTIPKIIKTMRYNYIAVEGNIGAGKTTLSTMISKKYNGRLILERFDDNPFLAKFYQDQDKYAFPLELSFLAERYQQLKRELASQELFTDFTISDYFLNKSLIFARKTLGNDEYQLFSTLFNIMNASLPKPDLLVHLLVSTKRLKSNIEKRGREYEQNIAVEYLEKIQESYLEYLKQQPNLRVLLLDVNALDFVAHPPHFEMIVESMNHDLPRGITRKRLLPR